MKELINCGSQAVFLNLVTWNLFDKVCRFSSGVMSMKTFIMLERWISLSWRLIRLSTKNNSISRRKLRISVWGTGEFRTEIWKVNCFLESWFHYDRKHRLVKYSNNSRVIDNKRIKSLDNLLISPWLMKIDIFCTISSKPPYKVWELSRSLSPQWSKTKHSVK